MLEDSGLLKKKRFQHLESQNTSYVATLIAPPISQGRQRNFTRVRFNIPRKALTFFQTKLCCQQKQPFIFFISFKPTCPSRKIQPNDPSFGVQSNRPSHFMTPRKAPTSIGSPKAVPVPCSSATLGPIGPIRWLKLTAEADENRPFNAPKKETITVQASIFSGAFAVSFKEG